ncbi:MAG: DUF1080 domain-containing protein [Pirellulaceae bacterium]|nr:DUF1080 domain-containing protein [Planctomycetales bacterium]
MSETVRYSPGRNDAEPVGRASVPMSTPMSTPMPTPPQAAAALIGLMMCLHCVPLLANEPDADAAVEAGFTRLFDGKSLAGWEGNESVFRVEEKSIVGGALDKPVARNEFLATTKDYGNFELRLQVRVRGEGANAGIQIRSRRIPNHHEMIGYQADVGAGWWGKLYDESRRNKVLAGVNDPQKLEPVLRLDDWNDYVIRCQGRRIQLWLNGVQTVDYTEQDGDIERRGLIAVQIHGGPPSEAWYRNIRIRTLEEGAE